MPFAIAALCRPASFPHRPRTVTLVQTHISYVLLADDHVYKVKKPVRFSFLDFSTLERRRRFCHEEVRLNRRLAPDAYFGVVGICPDGEHYRIGTEDDPQAIEYAVHMRRLPDDRLLDHLLATGKASLEMIDAIAARLAGFHREADASPEVTANGDRAAIWRILEDNYANARPFRGITIDPADDDAIQTFARSFLDEHEALFRRRQTEQRIRECHGDLHTEHICLTNGIVIFDCIEFNPLFRYCDVASDIAFLAMDLDFHGRDDLAARFIETYIRRSGDAEARNLVPFYQCYRAYVRGKVDSLKSTEAEVAAAERAAAEDSARRHFALAYRYTWVYRPALVAVAGLSGTGKSTVAAALHDRTGFALISSDMVRKHLVDPPPPPPAPHAYDTGLYAPAYTARTYRTLFTMAAEHLRAGRGVILDATFQRRADRDTARALAAAHHVPFWLVECRCGEQHVRQRLIDRSRRHEGFSDADWDVYLEQRRRFEPFGSDEDADRLVLDTSGTVGGTAAQVEGALRGWFAN
jgi:aminoglycoside phosphotransferase family enzyme/predicted kinase